jgi:hypothetical protein
MFFESFNMCDIKLILANHLPALSSINYATALNHLPALDHPTALALVDHMPALNHLPTLVPTLVSLLLTICPLFLLLLPLCGSVAKRMTK